MEAGVIAVNAKKTISMSGLI